MHDTLTKRRIYPAGMMRNVPYFNFPAFDKARDELTALGHDVVSPADMDRAHGFDAMALPADTDWSAVPEAAGTIDAIMARDLEALRTCDTIYMLRGWRDSAGARQEFEEAQRCGLEVWYEDEVNEAYSIAPATPEALIDREPTCGAVLGHSHQPLPRLSPEQVIAAFDAMPHAMRSHAETPTDHQVRVPAPTPQLEVLPVGETRITDALTGGQKGAKAERYDRLPVEPLAELARHYGLGARKYADHNYRKGYKWSLSYAALQRHLNAFWRGEDIDAETGSKHVIAAAFHCLALAEYLDTKRSHDDRYVREVPQ